jgi:type VI secretion system secreted protein Hcp
MSRFRSLTVLSATLLIAAGLVVAGGPTPYAAAAASDSSAPGISYQVTLRHGGGAVDLMTALAWNHEVTMVAAPPGGGGGGAGKRQHKPLVITKELDKASPILLKACATGQHFPELTLDAFRTRGGKKEVYLTVTLENVMITSFRTSGEGTTKPITSTGEETEQISFVFEKIVWNYRDQGVIFEDDLTK